MSLVRSSSSLKPGRKKKKKANTLRSCSGSHIRPFNDLDARQTYRSSSCRHLVGEKGSLSLHLQNLLSHDGASRWWLLSVSTQTRPRPVDPPPPFSLARSSCLIIDLVRGRPGKDVRGGRRREGSDVCVCVLLLFLSSVVEKDVACDHIAFCVWFFSVSVYFLCRWM